MIWLIPITAKTLPIPNACWTVTFCFWSDFCLIADAWSIFEETSGSQVQSKRQIGSRLPHGVQIALFSRFNSKSPTTSKWYRSFVSTQSVPFDEHLKYLNPIFNTYFWESNQKHYGRIYFLVVGDRLIMLAIFFKSVTNISNFETQSQQQKILNLLKILANEQKSFLRFKSL